MMQRNVALRNASRSGEDESCSCDGGDDEHAADDGSHPEPVRLKSKGPRV